MNDHQNKNDEITEIHQRFKGFYEFLGGSVIVMILLVIGAYIFIDQFTDFSMNAFTELVGVVGTALILDRIYKRRAGLELKEQLIFQMGGDEPIMTKQAVRMLRYKGWLDNNDLVGAKLVGANLQDLQLQQVNLQNADLSFSNLQGINLFYTNLSGANLTFAELNFANLTQANLNEANLWKANLKHANLRKTNLKDANLNEANLSGTYLREANLKNISFTDKNSLNPTVFPDGTFLSQLEDLERFTNPTHPDFITTLQKIDTIRAEISNTSG